MTLLNDIMSQQSKNEIFAVATVCLQRDGRYLGVYFLWGGGFRKKKEQTSRYSAIRDSHGTGEGSLNIKEGPALVPGRWAFNHYFYHGLSLLLISAFFSLITKADVQCMFDRPYAGYFS